MEEWIMTQAAFDRLWARVTGKAALPPTAPDQITQLRRFLDETAQSYTLETCLLHCAAAARAELQKLCRATRSRLQRLHTACYLLTGERYRPSESCPLTHDVLAALRLDCLSAVSRADAYAQAAQTAPSEDLRELYEALREEEQGHAAALRALIGRCLC